MTISGTFWYLLGSLSGVAIAFLLLPLLRDSGLSWLRRLALALAAACVPALAAFLFYLKTGAPGMAGNTPAPRTAIATSEIGRAHV